jgi:hypothetical protein
MNEGDRWRCLGDTEKYKMMSRMRGCHWPHLVSDCIMFQVSLATYTVSYSILSVVPDNL